MTETMRRVGATCIILFLAFLGYLAITDQTFDVRTFRLSKDGSLIPAKVGECYQTKPDEKWEDPIIYRIEEVGNAHYRVAYYYRDEHVYLRDSLASLSFATFSLLFAGHQIECPKGHTV